MPDTAPDQQNRYIGRGKPSFPALMTCLFLCVFTINAQATISVSLSPACISVAPDGTQQFQIATSGTTKNGIIWMVNGVEGGTPSFGTISKQGLYKAPVNPEQAVTATVRAEADGSAIVHTDVCVNRFTPAGQSYHVKITGSDSAGSGSETAPWRHIQHAINQTQPGDTVFVHDGTYNETIDISRSGSVQAGYITLQAAPGTSPIIDGSNLINQQYGMQGLVTIHNASYVRVKGFEIRNYISQTEFIAIGVLVTGSGERIEVRNNHIHHIEANNAPANGAANALGIAVYGLSEKPLQQVIIDSNELHDLKTGTGESLTIGGNTEHWQITNNFVHNNNFIGIDAIGYYNKNAPVPEKDRARYGWIADNTVRDLSVAQNPAVTFVAAAIGIYVDGGRDITIERNSVENTDGGIWLMSEKTGKNADKVTVRNNLVRFNQNSGIQVGGYSETDSGGLTNSIIANNILYQNNQRNIDGINAGELQIGYNAYNILFANNILFTNAKGYAITKFTPAHSSSVTIGYNLYYTVLGADQTRWFWINSNYYQNGPSAQNFDSFKTASGDLDNASQVSDPLFINPAADNFTPQTGSPAINTGLYDSRLGYNAVGPLDFARNPRLTGNKIDRGALEAQQ